MHSGYVFNIGFNKCGTTSLSAALNLLGVKTVHHRFTMTAAGELPRQIRLCDLWRTNLQRGRRPFFGLDGQLKGYTDFMGEDCFRLLDAAYPGSKFILTVRPLEDWLMSREKHVERNLRRPDYRGGFVNIDRPGWTAHYWAHIEETSRFFAGRPEDFLILDIPSGHGWDPVCQFLDTAVPNIPFPWGNKT